MPLRATICPTKAATGVALFGAGSAGNPCGSMPAPPSTAKRPPGSMPRERSRVRSSAFSTSRHDSGRRSIDAISRSAPAW